MGNLLAISRLALRRQDGFQIGVPSLQLGAGDAAVLFGPSGCGKTSALLALGGLLAPAFSVSGSVCFFGDEFGALPAARQREVLRRGVGYVLQDGIQALDPLLTVGAQTAAATGRPAAAIAEQLQRLGVDDAAALLARHPHAISGGQAQRVLLAAALLRGAPLLLLDEPTASLDGDAVDVLLALLQQERAAGRALLIASHDRRVLARLEPQVFTAEGGVFAPAAAAALAWPRWSTARQVGDVLLAATGVSVAFGGRPVFAGVDLELRAGSVTAVLGESGAGKTTLLLALAGLRAVDAGRIARPPARTAVQLLFQDAAGSLTPGRTLASLVAETAVPGFDAAATAATLGVSACMTRCVDALSGGERRRAALLRALSVQPSVLLLDEVTASLDRSTAIAVIELLLQEQQRRPLALLLSSHDEALVDGLADTTWRLHGGRLERC